MWSRTTANSAQGWEILVHELRSPSHTITEDVWFAEDKEGFLRVSVVDGVTATSRTPMFGQAKGGLQSARTAADSFRTIPGPIQDEDLQEANREQYSLRAPDCDWSRDYPQSAWAIAEAKDDKIKAWVGADVEVWVQYQDGNWHKMCDHNMIAQSKRKQLHELQTQTDLYKENFEEWILRESRLLDQPEDWVSCSMGRFDQLRWVEETHQGSWKQLVLGSDGACLSADRMNNLSEHLQEVGSRSSRDDLCLLQVIR